MPLTSCQSSMTLAAGAKVQKLITSPFIMRAIAMRISRKYRSIRFATLPACISRLPCLARQAQFLQPDISPYSIS